MITYRPMDFTDVDAVAAIEAQVSEQPWSLSLFADEFRVVDPARRRWVVAVNPAGDVVGFGGLMVTGDEGHVMNIATRPDHQGQGIGRAVMAWLWRAALDAQVSHLTLEVRASNAAARRLYQRLGFAPVGVRRGYYRDGEDALIMWVHDIAPMESIP